MPFRKALRGLGILALWLVGLGGVSFGFYELNDYMDRIDARAARHTWGDIRDRDAAVVASDALVSHFGQAQSAGITGVGRPKKVTIAGGRPEWLYRFQLHAGPTSDPQKVCVYVWKADSNGDDEKEKHFIVVERCRV